MLDLIEHDLKINNIKFLVIFDFLNQFNIIKLKSFQRLDGSVNQNNREKVLKQFKNDKKIYIFLISLKVGGVGLNLVAANHVNRILFKLIF